MFNQFEDRNMSNLVTKILLSAAFCLPAIAPATANPAFLPKASIEVAGQNDIVQVNHRHRGFHRHANRGFYNGHRGFRHKRRGYRYHNGFWFPPAAFSFGIIIDGGRHVRPGYTNPQHIRWCHGKYRSYREWDNSYQPYHGPRRECRSPYY